MKQLNFRIGENTMLIAENMLKELNKENTMECMSDNDDIDFGTVLEFCCTSDIPHKLRCSDGIDRILSFDN